MTKPEILSMIDEIDLTYELSYIQTQLSKRYELSGGQFDVPELRRALFDKLPVVIPGRIVIGYDPETQKFIDSNNNYFSIERPINAIIVSSAKFPAAPVAQTVEDTGYPFAIVGTDQWNEGHSEFFKHIEPLRTNAVFLPTHSAVFNFLNPTDKTKKENIVSMLNGANINIYEKDRYFDNILHEIGHLFWRTKVNFDEKERFEEIFKRMSPSAIIEFEWEKENAEEYFCTIYKWYLKSMFVHQSFMSILAHESADGLQFLKDVFKRSADQQAVLDAYELAKGDIDNFFFPRYDKTTGNYIRKKGATERIQNLEIPESAMEDVDSMRDGVMFVNLSKAIPCIPIQNGRIVKDKFQGLNRLEATQWQSMNKARSLTGGKPVIMMDMDGVVAGFAEGYKKAFGRDARKDDLFTVQQQCLTEPHFFRTLPVIEKGRELYEQLKEEYTIVFLTAPMEGHRFCKVDKIAWARKNFPDVKTVLFSTHKAEYAGSDHSVLIDDMPYQLEPFEAAGGTAINSALDNKKIIALVDAAFEQKEEVKAVEEQLNKMDVDLYPSPEEKESGDYKKGDIVFKGIKIKIENPKGSVRFGFDSTGTKWMNRMKHHYGYIHNGPEGNDGDKIDCFIGNKFNGNKVFVVNQKGRDGLFDEHKIMLCFETIDEAREGYLSNYQKGWDGIMSITATNTKKLRDWLETGNKTEPF